MTAQPDRPGRRGVLPALGAVLLLLALAACGEEEDGEPVGPGQPTTTTGEPDPGPGPEHPDPDRELSALRCQGEPNETLDATGLQGLRFEKAEDRVQEHGCSIRIVEEDGESLAVTDDFRPDRVNVAVDDGDVSAVIGAY